MGPSADHRIAELRCAPGELSFLATVGGREQRIWLRTESDLVPNADAALAVALLPAMRFGGRLTVEAPLSRRLLRTQREFQALHRAWSNSWEFEDFRPREIEVAAPAREGDAPPAEGRVATFFSGGVDSWSTVLAEPEITDLVFVRGFDLLHRLPQHGDLADEVERRLRDAAEEIGKPLHVVETNLRELSDPLVPWEAHFGCAAAAVALFLAPLFERMLIAGDGDYETQTESGVNRLVESLWSTEALEICEAGGRMNRVERTALIAAHPTVRRTLRTCWENPNGAYNCGRCRKCLMTMTTLEALGARAGVETFPAQLDLDAIPSLSIDRPLVLGLWEDLLDCARAARRPELERPVEAAVAQGRRRHGLGPAHRSRNAPGPPPTVRIAVVVPAWRQADYLAAAVDSALGQEVDTGVGVVIVDDGCPDPRTARIGRALSDAHPDRVELLRQANGGVSAARNAGIRRALARWPQVEAVFPLDADNLLSPQTLALLRETLAQHPEAAWASPALEDFGADEKVRAAPPPYLAYRQLFNNQSDTGSLIRRSLFEAGIWFDETVRNGFEDWELFLRASLAGLRGIPAGRCGFRYRRRPGSMLAHALDRSTEIEANIRGLHSDAYEPGALARMEHAEAPRFALVRCDAGDVLLTAACELEPHRIGLDELLRPRRLEAATPPLEAHVPAITVLTTGAALDWLRERELLAETLLNLQVAVRDEALVELRLLQQRTLRGGSRTPRSGEGPAGLALRTRTLAELAPGEMPTRAATRVEAEGRGRPPTPPADPLLKATVREIGAGLAADRPPIIEDSHASFFERMHVDLLRTTLPSTAASAAPDLAVTSP